MRLEIDIPEHHYNNIMALDSVCLGRAPYKGIIMYAINAIKQGKVLEQELTTKNDLGVDCISRADAIGCLAGQIELSPSNVASVHEYLKCVNKRLHDLPSVTSQGPKTGHWIETHDDWGNGIITDRKYKCSVCHGKHIDPEMGEWHEVFDYKYPFCPNCGAKMAESEGKE